LQKHGVKRDRGCTGSMGTIAIGGSTTREELGQWGRVRRDSEDFCDLGCQMGMSLQFDSWKSAEINDSILWASKQVGFQNSIQFSLIQGIQTAPHGNLNSNLNLSLTVLKLQFEFKFDQDLE
jgi:hypothetical protein